MLGLPGPLHSRYPICTMTATGKVGMGESLSKPVTWVPCLRHQLWSQVLIVKTCNHNGQAPLWLQAKNYLYLSSMYILKE